jgi:hypothetical protein
MIGVAFALLAAGIAVVFLRDRQVEPHLEAEAVTALE